MSEQDGKTARVSNRVLHAIHVFEKIILVALGVILTVVIIVALTRVIRGTYGLLVIRALDPIDYESFKKLFGMIMTMLIALEFLNSIVRLLRDDEGINHVRIVLLIAILAISRKFIITDPTKTDPWVMAGISVSILSLGLVYWLLGPGAAAFKRKSGDP